MNYQKKEPLIAAQLQDNLQDMPDFAGLIDSLADGFIVSFTTPIKSITITDNIVRKVVSVGEWLILDKELQELTVLPDETFRRFFESAKIPTP